MIHVTIRRQSDEHISFFSVEGHADFAASGSDIVCAGASAITVGTVNSIEALCRVVVESEMEHGMLNVTVPELEDDDIAKRIQLLLESMIVMLQTIEQSYGRYIRLETIYV